MNIRFRFADFWNHLWNWLSQPKVENRKTDTNIYYRTILFFCLNDMKRKG